MAKIFLNVGETNVNIANDGDKVFGQTGDESVNILADVTGVELDGNVEAVTLGGNLADYEFQQQGNQILVYSGTELVTTIPVQTDDDGTQLTIGDGSYNVEFGEGAVINIGGTDVPQDEPGPVAPPTEAPTLSIDNVAVAEGDTGTATATFTVNLSKAPGAGETVTVDYATEDDTATAGTDYVAANGTLTFAENETTKTIEVTVNGDTVDEGDETFNVALSNVDGAISGETPVITDPTGVGTITDDDPASGQTFTLTASADSVNEGDSAVFTLANGVANTEYAYEVTGDGAAAQVATVTTDADGNATITVAASDVLSTDQAITVSIIGEDLTSTVTAVAVNDAPALTDAAATLADGVEDAAYTVNAADLLAGYTDEEGDAMSVANLTADNDAEVVDNGDGSFTINPVADFNGTVTLSYDVTDGTDATAATQAVVFAAVNDAPTTTAATAAATEAGVAVEGQLVAEDVDGDDLTFSLDAAVEGLTLNADGSYSFDPSANTAVQALTYTDEPLDVVANYTVDDGNGETVQNTLTVTVDPTPLTFELQQSTDTAEEGSVVEYTIVASEAVQADFTGEIQIALADGDTASLADFGSGSFNPQTVTIATGETTSTVATITPTNDATTEMPETFSATATVDGFVVEDVQTTVQDPSSVGGLGQTFNLTTGVDTIPGLVGSAGSTGTDGNDTIVGTVDGDASTFSDLDSINGGLGTDELKINDVATSAAGIDLSIATISNVETMTIQSINNVASNATSGVMDTSSVAGLETLNVTKADSVYVESADTTDINVSGATGGTVEVDGGKDVAVTDGSAVNNITIGGATAPAGTINVTDSVQDTGVITIDGGTDVTVDATVENTNASADVTGGAITIGGTTPATGTVSVTQNLNSDGTGDGTGDGLTGGAVTITGGSTVDLTVNATSDAKDETESEGTQIGALKVNSDGNTTDVNVTQNDDVTTFTKEGSDMVASTSVVTFKALSAGETVTVDGLVFEASENLDAEQVAAAFSNLGDDSGAGNVPTTGDIVSAGGPVTNGFYIGNTTGAWTSGAADGANVTFTKKDHSADDIVVASSDTASKPGTDFTQGDAAVADSTSTNTVAYGAVTIDEDGTAAASIENISVDGYVNSTIGATNSVDALKTLLLTNSAGTMDVTTAAATLDLTVDDVNDAVTLNATSLLDLTLNAVGEDSAFGLTSADTTDLTIDATADLDLTGSTFTNLVNATIEGAGAVTLDGQVAATLETIDAATNTGGVTASVNGNATAVTGGDGDDEITVLNADTPIDQEISLGAGDDAIDLSNGGTVTAVAPTATIDGGAGTDLLAMDSIAAAGADAAFAAKFTNFELLEIAEKVVLDNGVDTAQDVTVDLSVLEYDYVITNGTTDSADVDISGSALILDNMANGGTVELNDTQDETYLTTTATGAGSIKVNVLDADANTADSLNLFTMVDAGLVEAQGVETINVTGSNSVFLKDTDLTTVTVNGNHATALDADGNPTAYADIHVGLDATSTNVELVDASASMGALIFDSLDDTTATVINGGHGNDEISIAGQNDEVYAGAGDDRIIVADTADAAKVEGGDGNDLFDMTGATLGKEAYATILDFEAGDQIAVNASSFKSQGVVVTDPSELTLTDWFTAAFNQTVATEAIWFQHNDNTYIVDNTTTDDFVAGDDVIIKLAGVVDLDQAAFNDSGNLEMA